MAHENEGVAAGARVALVTGATAGMGTEIVRQLGVLGYRVIVGARDAKRGAAVAESLRTEGIEALSVELDVTKPNTARVAADVIAARFGRLDVLVNNAGISRDHNKAPTETTLDDLRQTYETNVFGVATVTNTMLPLLLKSADARIINQSMELGLPSRAAQFDSPAARSRMPGYASSKAALNLMTLEYAKFLRDTAVKVYATAPGLVSTALNNHRPGGATPAEGARVAVDLATRSDPAPTGTMWGRKGQISW